MKKLYRLLPVILLLQFALPSSAQQTDNNTCDIDLSSNGDSLSMQKGPGYPVKIADSHYILYTNREYVKIHKSNSVSNPSTITNVNGGFCYRTKDDGNVDTTNPRSEVSVPENDKIDWRCISFNNSDTIDVAQFIIGGKLTLELNRKPITAAEKREIKIIVTVRQGKSNDTVDSTYTVNLNNPTIDFSLSANDTIQSIKLVSDEYVCYQNDNIFRNENLFSVEKGFGNDRKFNSFPISYGVTYIGPDYELESSDIKIQVNKVVKPNKEKNDAKPGKVSKVEKDKSSSGILDKLLPFIIGIALLVVLFAVLYMFFTSEKGKSLISKIQKDYADKAEEDIDIEKKLDYIEYSHMSNCLSDIERILNIDLSDTVDNARKWARLVDAVVKQQEICTSKTELVESMKRESALHTDKINELTTKHNEEIDTLNRQHAESLNSLKKDLDVKSELHTHEINELTAKFNEVIDDLNRQHAESLNSLEKDHSDEIDRIRKEHLDDLKDKELQLDILDKDITFGKERFLDTVSALIHEISDLATSISQNAVQGTFVYDHASRIVSSSNSLTVLEKKISEQADISEQSLSSFINEVSTEIDRALNDSRSWVNEAIRLSAYHAVPAISDELKAMGLSKEKINRLIDKASDLLLVFGYHLDEIPALFKTIGDKSTYDKESLDTFIQDIYPEFREMLSDNVVFDFFKIGYKKDNSSKRTTVTF